VQVHPLHPLTTPMHTNVIDACRLCREMFCLCMYLLLQQDVDECADEADDGKL